MSRGEMDFEHFTLANIERWDNTSELDTHFDALRDEDGDGCRHTLGLASSPPAASGVEQPGQAGEIVAGDVEGELGSDAGDAAQHRLAHLPRSFHPEQRTIGPIGHALPVDAIHRWSFRCPP